MLSSENNSNSSYNRVQEASLTTFLSQMYDKDLKNECEDFTMIFCKRLILLNRICRESLHIANYLGNDNSVQICYLSKV